VHGGPIGVLRIGVVRALRADGLDLDAARHAADALLLFGLAADLLGIAGAADALRQATAGGYAAARRMRHAVLTATGLPPGNLTLPDGVLAAVRPEDDGDPFEGARGLPDPFGWLATRLRSHAVTERDGQLVLGTNAARKDEGGFYTPWTLARRLARHLVEGFDAVPSMVDPACGSGTFLVAAFDLLHEELARRAKADPSVRVEPVAWSVAALHGVEWDPTALLAARLALAARAVLAERASGRAVGQLALFGQGGSYGPLIADRVRPGDALSSRPDDTMPGTERLALRLQARDTPGRLAAAPQRAPVRWDAEFPLRFSDGEGAFPGPGGFDLLIANPPFVPVDRIAPEQRALLMRTLETAQRRFDLFIGFAERSLTLLAPGGRATLLLPRTFLTEANAEKCRQLLLDRATVERVEELGPVRFDGASLDCVALTFRARRAGPTATVQVHRRGAHRDAHVPQDAYRRAPRSQLRPELADPAAETCLRVAANCVPLGRWFCASWGARGTPVRDFHLDAPSHPLAKPMLKGDDVSPFRVRASSRWLLYDPERLYRPSRPEFFESPKLVVAKVTGARGIVAAVDEGGHYADDSLACVVRKADLAAIPQARRRAHRIAIGPGQAQASRVWDLHLVAALVQTPLVQEYYRVQLGGGLNVFPELIEALPLPRMDRLEEPEAYELAALGRAAARGEPFAAGEADALARVLYGLERGREEDEAEA